MMIEATAKILVVTSTFPRWTNDTEPSFVFDLCNYLHDQGMEVDVLAPHAHGAKSHEIINGINVYRYQYFFSRLQTLTYTGGILANLKKNPLNFVLVPFMLVSQALAVSSRLRSTNYRLIHAHWLIPQGLVCAFISWISAGHTPALICTSHGGDLYALDNYMFRTIKKWVINRCAQFCVVSNAMKMKVTSLGIAEQKIHVMPMGVDLKDQFRPMPGILRHNNRLIFVGRLVEKKGVGYLLDAMVNVLKVKPDVELLIIGDGPLRASLERQVEHSGLSAHVHFLGSVQHQQLPEYYSSASVAIVPSIIAESGDQEGLGLVIIEALGCGCAVIASSLEAIRDVLDDNSGCLVTAGASSELAQKISWLLDNPGYRSQMAEQGRAKVLEAFDREVTGQRYFQLMSSQSLINR